MSFSDWTDVSFFGRKLTKRHFMALRTVGVLVIVAGVVVVLGAQFGSGDSATTEPDVPALQVETVAAEAVTQFEQNRTYSGVIKPRRQSELRFLRTGELEALLVDEGAAVQAGQELARLDVRSLNAKRQELVARRDAAQASLDELRAGPRKQTIEAARASVNELHAQFKLADIEHRRNQGLSRTNAISQGEYDRTEFGLESARARWQAAQQMLDELEEGTREERVRAQEAVVAQLNSSIDDIDVQLDDSVMRAPYDGRIAMRLVDEGTVVSPTATIFHLLESDHLEVWVGLPPSLAKTVQIGDTYEVVVDGARINANVHRLMPQLDSTTRTQTVVLSIAAEQTGSVVPGQIARIELSRPVEADGVWLPTSALVRGSRGLWSVYTVERDASDQYEVISQDVELLHTQGDRVLVRGTLIEGQQVVRRGAYRIAPGQRVTVQTAIAAVP